MWEQCCLSLSVPLVTFRDMLHIVAYGGSKVRIIHAVKGHLDLMMGEIMDRIEQRRPMYSFEPTEADGTMVRALVDDLRLDADAKLVFLEDRGGQSEEISEELFMNLLDLGLEISKQVRRDTARKLGEEE